MPKELIEEIVVEVEPLPASEPIGSATRKVIASGLPALPAVDEDGKFAGIFGEREFMAAFFPGYMKNLASAAAIRRTIDETIERRLGCAEEPISEYLTTDHVARRRRPLRYAAGGDLPPPPRARDPDRDRWARPRGRHPRRLLPRPRRPRDRHRSRTTARRRRGAPRDAAISAATRSPERTAPSM